MGYTNPVLQLARGEEPTRTGRERSGAETPESEPTSLSQGEGEPQATPWETEEAGSSQQEAQWEQIAPDFCSNSIHCNCNSCSCTINLDPIDLHSSLRKHGGKGVWKVTRSDKHVCNLSDYPLDNEGLDKF